MTEKERFRRHAPELGLLLWAVWNPIGAQVPIDEYDAYVPTVWKLRSRRASVDELSAELGKIAEDRIRMARGASRIAAKRVTEWCGASTTPTRSSPLVKEVGAPKRTHCLVSTGCPHD